MRGDLNDFRVFVYGTLKRGYGNWQRFLKDAATFDGEAVSVKSDYHMLYGPGFPYLREGADGSKVKGELFKVSARTLARLDRLEGVPHHYQRKTRHFINLRTGKRTTAFVYLQTETHDSIRPKNGVVEWKGWEGEEEDYISDEDEQAYQEQDAEWDAEERAS